MSLNPLRRLLALTALVLLVLVPAFGLTRTTPTVRALTNCDVADLTVDAEEQAFLTLINNHRAANGGAPALVISAPLNRPAIWLSEHMSTAPYSFDHTDRLGRTYDVRFAQCDVNVAGFFTAENIAAGTNTNTAQAAFTQWVNSPGHNTNMLNPAYRSIGIARAFNVNAPFSWYWTTTFSSEIPAPPQSNCATPGPIYRRVAGNWQGIAGAASDVASGAGGATWAIGPNQLAGGNGIYQWNGNGWTAVAGAACKLAIDATGSPWALQANGAIYRRTGGNWVGVPGAARDIAGGISGAFYALGTTASPGGYLIYSWNGAGWIQIPGAAEQIAVDSANNLWARQTNNSIYRWNGAAWTAIPGAALELAAGSEVWALGTNPLTGGFGIYQWNGTGWIAMAGAAKNLAVDSAGVVWALQ